MFARLTPHRPCKRAGVLTPNQKGAIVEAAIAYEAIRAGAEVFKPLSEHSRADLIFGIGGRLFRVQCKSAARSGEVLRITLQGSRHTPRGYVRSRYSAEEVDLIAAHCLDLGRSYLFPFALVSERRSAIHLRLSPARNGQKAAVHSAADHEFPGAVAQLARASAWHVEGRRFESDQLHSSESSSESALTVGADRFRRYFGQWIERASKGAEIVITRRGRPYAKLGPAQVQAELATAD